MMRDGRRVGWLLFILSVVVPATGCGPAHWLPRYPFAARPEAVLMAAPEPEADNPPADTRPIKSILALSGGGSFGAFTAGVLNGWTRTNQRPEFDVVTGISTGALIAPMAFLGSKYDSQIRLFYTEVRRKDVFAFRSWVTVPFRDSLASTAPLRNLVESGLTEELVTELEAEHKKGRRLYIATTNLQTRKPVVWDLGAIATNRPTPEARRLIVDLLVASASVPGVFPPVPVRVEIDGKTEVEQHVDGGVSSSVFVPPSVLESAKGAELFVVLSHKPYPEATRVKPRALRVLGASGTALIHAHARSDISNLYYRAKVNSVKFRMIALRQDFEVNENAIEFDQPTMNKLYVEGVRVGVAGPTWDTNPIEYSPGEAGEIRTGRPIQLDKPAKPGRP